MNKNRDLSILSILILHIREITLKRILVTGGTTFVSKYVADYYVNAGYEVYVLNRNTKPQVQGVKLIEADRHNLKGILKAMPFDVVADITAYNAVEYEKHIGERLCAAGILWMIRQSRKLNGFWRV